mmetsp:Transcript_51060/g.108487  ORF Transcript_51060/g.108487 Transcript_51060/m.108487 type:complete len:171 (+) Transcript_51060:3-515(+)
MRPYVKERFEKDFGADGVEQIVNLFGGSFELLQNLTEFSAAGITAGIAAVRMWHKHRLQISLQLTEHGMKDAAKASSTGEAMVAAAKLVFGLPVCAFDKGTLELAQVGGAKIETSDAPTTASLASPLTGEVLKELVCDETIHAIMKTRLPEELYQNFQLVIKDKCWTAPK